MMKKTLSALLVGSMLLFPVPALATDTTDTIHSLSFDTVEEEMNAHSSLILHMGDSVTDASSTLSNGLGNLRDAKTKLVTAVTNILLGLNQMGISEKTYFSGMTPADLIMPLAPALNTSDSVTNINSNNTFMVNYTTSLSMFNQASILLNQINNLDAQITSMADQQNDLWKSWLQVEQGKDQTLWGAQQIYLSYYSLYDQKDNLSTNLALLQKQLSAVQLKESLGLVTHLQVIEVESQIKDLNIALDQLNKGLDGIKGQLNVFLGQDFDTSLQLKEPSTLFKSKITEMDYDQDLADALVQSFNVRLQNDDISKQEDAKRNFTLAFHNAYQDVLDKKKALDLESYKLTNEKTKYDQAVLMNSLGLLANLNLEGARSQYTTQVNKVDTAKQDLLKAYTAYDWMKQGLTISSTASAASQSTGTAGASGTTTTAGY